MSNVRDARDLQTAVRYWNGDMPDVRPQHGPDIRFPLHTVPRQSYGPEGNNLVQWKDGSLEKPVHVFHGQKHVAKFGVVTAPSPPRSVKDILFSPQYSRGQFEAVASMKQKANSLQYVLIDPVTGQKTFQFHSEKGGQGEGF